MFEDRRKRSWLAIVVSAAIALAIGYYMGVTIDKTPAEPATAIAD